MKFFSELPVSRDVIRALEQMGFVEMTDIQAKAIPECLKGRDVIAQSITGSGKTAAFGIPIVENVMKGKGLQAVIIGPTRELVNQISTEMKKFSRYKHLNIATVFGGVSLEPQVREIRRSEILVGTPGRMLDHMQRGTLRLNNVNILVLDEADRMLDMGFIDDIKRIISQVPEKSHFMLFSATISREVTFIAKKIMKNPIKIDGKRFVSQHLLKHYYYDIQNEKKISFLNYLIKKENPSLAIVFCATRDITDFVADELQKSGIEAKAIHGRMGQDARTRVLEGFHCGRPQILVATDVAARGLDIKNVSHIINYDTPKTIEGFTHRIGRTARFGKTGKTISLLSRQDHEHFRKIISKIEIKKLHIPNDFVPRKVFFRKERRYYRRGSYSNRRSGYKRNFRRR